MGTYRLSEQADADLVRIHQWGVRHHGEAQAGAARFSVFSSKSARFRRVNWPSGPRLGRISFAIALC